jgi:uncharacterized protein (TIRG00374 family)
MRKFLLIVLKLAISASLLYFATRQLNFGVVAERFSRVAPLWLLAAVVIALLQNLVVAMRWQLILKVCGVALSPITTIRFSLIGAFFGQVLPATVGGDAARVILLARQGTGWWKATCSVLLDRFIGVFLLAALVAAGFYWSFNLIQNPIGRLALLVIGVGSIAAAACFLALSHIRFLQQWRLTRRFADLSRLASQCLFTSRHSAFIVLSSILSHVLTAVITWSIGKAVSAQLEFVPAFLLILPVLLISTAPISIAGWGVRESAMVLAFSYAGLSESDALIVSVLMGAIMLAVGIAGGAVWLFSPEKIRIGAEPLPPLP